MDTFIKEANEKGDFPLWIPYIFGGMPAYGSLLLTGDRWWDIAPQIILGFTVFMGKLFNSDVARVAFFYIFYGIGFYFLLRVKEMTRLISFFGSFAAVFSTSVVVWVMIGHNTKPIALATIPFILLFSENLKSKFSILQSVFLIIATHLLFESGHAQMIFYAFATIGIYFLVELIYSAISKVNFMGNLRSLGMFVVAAGFGFLMSADRYFSAMDYTPYSTRGSAPIVQNENSPVDETGGNPYDYATMWSFIPQDMATFIIPSFYGFGELKYDYQNPSNSNTLLAQLAQRNDGKVPAYFSRKTSEDAPPYMGILVFALALFGAIYYRKKPFVLAMIIVSIFALLISFGSEFPVIFNLFFEYFPNFNKFRAPSMALVILQFAFPLLAAFGLGAIVDIRKNWNEDSKKSLYAFMGGAGLFLFAGIVYYLLFELSYKSEIANSSLATRFPDEYKAQIVAELQNFIWSTMISDWFINAFMLLILAVGAYFFALKKLSINMYMGLAIALLVVDMWRIGFRPMNVSERPVNQTAFAKSDIYQQLDQDKSIYRIADFTTQSPNQSAYFLKQSVNGYHAAKLRIYQDLLDVTSGGSTSMMQNPFVWDLMNVKYIIYPQQLGGMQPLMQSQQTGAFLYENPFRLERATFIRNVAVDKPLEILNKLKYEPNSNFNPRDIAYIESDLKVKLDSLTGDEKAEITKFENHHIEMNVKATGNNFLFVSEIYYPNGWTAYLNNKEVDIIKTNFAFRGIVVPAGEHKLEFRYEDKAFEKGKMISSALNVVVILALILGIWIEKKGSFSKKEAQV